MYWMVDFLQSRTTIHLVTALLHSLWQGLLVGALLLFALKMIPARRAATRYLLSVAALAVVLLVFLVTWSVLDVGPTRGTAVGEASPETVATTVGDSEPSRESARETSPAVASSGASGPGLPQAPRMPAAWHGWLAVAWGAGVMLMLLRAASAVRGAGRLRQGCVALESPVLSEMVERLREGMRVGRRVKVVVGEHLSVPAVMGVIYPVLLLPAGMISPLSPDQMRMVIAHELAHIRRHDYLVNIVQLFLEAVLFFNPAVWWISRQIRLEREACCDNEAVRATGEAQAYAETLVEVARRSGPTGLAGTAAPAFAQPRRGWLLSRIQRLVRPGHTPAVQVPWLGAAFALAACLFLLLALRAGTSAVVEAAAQWISPEERVERITAIAETHAREEAEDEYHLLEKVRIRGRIETTDGTPLPAGWKYVNARTKRARARIGHSLNVDGVAFEGSVTPGRIVLWADAPGYAPVFLGPYEREPGQEIEDVLIRLDPGFAARLRAVDEGGRPVPGVRCRVNFEDLDVGAGVRDLVTDEAGEAIIEHATTEADLHVSLRAPGYQYDEKTTRLRPDEPFIVRLRAATPLRGRVVSESGQAIRDAQVRIARRDGFSNFFVDPREAWSRKRYPVWTVDEEGRFLLDSLRDDCTYSLYCDAPGYGPSLVADVRTGQRDPLVLTLQPPFDIRCRIVGGLEKLHGFERGEPRIGYRNPIVIGNESYSNQLYADVSIEGEVGLVTIQDCHSGAFSVGGDKVRTTLRERGRYSYTIDLREPEEGGEVAEKTETRRVVVRVRAAAGDPTPEGKLRVDYVPPGVNGYKPFWLPLNDGQVSIDVPLGSGQSGKFRYGPLFAAGYWIADKSEIPVPPGEDPMTIEVDAHPAGAVFGRVLDAEGEPVERFNVTLIKVRKPATPDNAWPRRHEPMGGDHPKGKFMLDAIPLGGVYRVYAGSGEPGDDRSAMSDLVTVDAARPIREIDIRIPQGIDVPIHVVSDDGKPIAGAKVALDYSTPYSHSFGGATRATDLDGMIVFKGVNPELPGSHKVRVEPYGSYRGALEEIKVDGGATTIELERGRDIPGQ